MFLSSFLHYMYLACWLKDLIDIIIEGTPLCLLFSFWPSYPKSLYLDFIPVCWSWVARKHRNVPEAVGCSWLGSSGVSPVNFVRYVWVVTLPHQLLALCILSPLMFLQTFPHDYLTFVFPPFNVNCAKFLTVRGLFHVVIIKSACSSHSSFPLSVSL